MPTPENQVPLGPEGDEIVAEIARAREEARARADREGKPEARPKLAAPQIVEAPPSPVSRSAPPSFPVPPDASAVNESWHPPSLQGRGLLGLLRRAADVLVRPQLAARVRFDSDQVRFDNDLLTYVAEHFAATHRHYDRLIADSSVRMDEIDERHLQLQKRFVTHLEDLVRRVDLVLEIAERSRLSGEADLRRVVSRLEALEGRLGELEQRLRRG
jgi:hypothetical protein